MSELEGHIKPVWYTRGKQAQRGQAKLHSKAAGFLGLHSQQCSLLKQFLAASVMKVLIPRRPLLDLGAATKLGDSSRL